MASRYFKGLVVLSFFTLGTLLGCQNKPCREIEAEKMAEKRAQNPNLIPAEVKGDGTFSKTPTPTAALGLKVKVYKADGSLQCGMGTKIALETMEKQLKGIKVFSRTNKNDGLMRIQVCGAPTGQSNVYEINRTDLERALKAGFKEWTQD
jgi:hypothetical protein